MDTLIYSLLHLLTIPIVLLSLEAIILDLDSVVIVGTGACKTMPFMMPLLLDKIKKVIIVPLLKVLQADQVRIFSNFCIYIYNIYEKFWGHLEICKGASMGIVVKT